MRSKVNNQHKTKAKSLLCLKFDHDSMWFCSTYFHSVSDTPFTNKPSSLPPSHSFFFFFVCFYFKSPKATYFIFKSQIDRFCLQMNVCTFFIWNILSFSFSFVSVCVVALLPCFLFGFVYYCEYLTQK